MRAGVGTGQTAAKVRAPRRLGGGGGATNSAEGRVVSTMMRALEINKATSWLTVIKYE